MMDGWMDVWIFTNVNIEGLVVFQTGRTAAAPLIKTT